ncbi:TetR/AcrR family transcriptional regulator C-terminal domain-containing protein [uncultured Caulobacter sp.]|uniref:TetR/AcrR family transcriptional regulator n=1 Tax=uncultured Caulobacter sp. TaxID=158749 RepID=UPI00261D4B12|nr:TetR/AcrR family transcriptional regulator C-terminal domain-containing protein [uncultured Caulobacter sp.]
MSKAPGAPRRADALSKARIVEAAIEILDEAGDGALTFRALASRLATGAGAIYWHVADKTALLTAAASDVVDHTLAGGGDAASPRAAIQAVGLRLFDLIDARPWVGAHLAREPLQPAGLAILEALGRPLEALGAPSRARFEVVTALATYILGAAAQNAANARQGPPGRVREDELAKVATAWAGLDPKRYPFLRGIVDQMAQHDDREQFRAGLNLILRGVETLA